MFSAILDILLAVQGKNTILMWKPAFARFSKSTGMSKKSSGRQPPEGPPVWTALNLAPSIMPLPMSNMILRRGAPMDTPIRPQLATFPVSANTAVPGLFSVPIPVNQSAPRFMISGTVARDLSEF